MGRLLRMDTPRPVVTLELGRKVLRVGGVIQSVHVGESYQADVWDAMLPRREPTNALILGLGGGTIAALLTARWGPVPITGVEHDPAVVYLAREEFGLGQLEHVTIAVADAFSFMQRCQHTYDAICVDLYTAGKMAHGIFAKAFLRDVARALAPGGTVAFNLWRSPYLCDQLRRLGRVLAVERVAEVEANVIVHCGHLPMAELDLRRR